MRRKLPLIEWRECGEIGLCRPARWGALTGCKATFRTDGSMPIYAQPTQSVDRTGGWKQIQHDL